MGDVTDPQPPPPLAILVHGTFAGFAAPEDEPPRWWEERSPFRAALSEACGGMEVTHFCWGDGGANSEAVRRSSADRLLAVLRGLEQARRPYHLVGHSHGGSVIWQALVRACADGKRHEPELRHLRSWTTVGTPFQDFAPAHIELVGAILAVIVSVAWLWACGQTWGPLLVNWDQICLIYRHAFHLQLRDLHQFSLADVKALDLVRVVLSAFVALVVVIVTLIAGGVLQPLTYGAPGRTAPQAPAPPSTGVAIAAAVSWVLGTALIWLVVGNGVDVLALLVATLLALGLVYVVLQVSRRIASGWWAIQQRPAEVRAARCYGHLWRAIFHPDDEAIAALRCALLPAPAIIPRPQSLLQHRPARLIDAPREVPRLIADQFVWEAAMTRIQGDDLDGCHVRTSGLAPRVLASRLVIAASVLEPGIEHGANEKGATLFRQLRTWLADAYTARSVDEAARKLTHTLTFDAVIHNAYFFEEGPPGEKGLRPLIARAEVVALVSRGIVGLPPRADDAGRAGAERHVVVSRRQRHLLLHWSRVGVAVSTCIAVFVSCHVGYGTLVRPLQQDEQYESLVRLPSRPGALATSDSPVVGAFLARLAVALGADADAALNTYVTEPNARAVAAQRLAFAGGFRGDTDQPVLQSVPGLDEPGKRRLQALATLSRFAGLVAAGEAGAEDHADEAIRLWPERECRETDLDAAAALVVPVVAAGQGPEAAGAFAEKAARLRNGLCGRADTAGDGAWARGLLADAAHSLLTWDETGAGDSVKRRRRLQTAQRLLAAPVGGSEALDGLGADSERAQQDCRKSAGSTMSLLQVAAQSNLCTAAAGSLEQAIRTALQEGRLDAISEGPLGPAVSAVRADCETTPLVASNQLAVEVGRTFQACRGALDAARRIVAATAVQLAADRQLRYADFVERRLEDLSQTAITYGDGLLWPIVDVQRRRIASAAASDEMGVPAPNAAAALARRIALAHDRLAWGCRTQPAGEQQDPPCVGPARLDYVWTAVGMLDVVDPVKKAALLVHAGGRLRSSCRAVIGPDGVADPGAILQYAKAVDVAIAGGRMPATDVARLSKLRDQAVDLLLCPSDTTPAPPCPASVNQWSPDQMLTLAEVASTRPAILEQVRGCIRSKIDTETSATRRAWFVQKLANSYLLDRDLYQARTAALSAGAVNYVLAGLCPILVERLAGPGGRVREGNWPQPVPVTFGSLPRFAYDNDRPQPLQCRGSRTFDLE